MKALLTTLYFILLPLTSIKASPAAFKATAVSNKSGKTVYNEEHQVSYEGGLVKNVITTYKDTQGNIIATLTSKFGENNQLPNTEFIDKRTGYRETTTLKNNEYEITTQIKDGKKKSRSISVEDNLVCGQGYHNYIIKNLDSFKVNETRELRFIIPSMRDYFTFDLTYLGPLNNEKPDEVTFRLDITNFILKMFADKIQVTYSKKDKVLLQYNGLTNLKDESGDQYDAKLTYEFP